MCELHTCQSTVSIQRAGHGAYLGPADKAQLHANHQAVIADPVIDVLEELVEALRDDNRTFKAAGSKQVAGTQAKHVSVATKPSMPCCCRAAPLDKIVHSCLHEVVV